MLKNKKLLISLVSVLIALTVYGVYYYFEGRFQRAYYPVKERQVYNKYLLGDKHFNLKRV